MVVMLFKHQLKPIPQSSHFYLINFSGSKYDLYLHKPQKIGI